MRRLGRVFLTTSAVLVLLVNLIMILLYGKQFYACSESFVVENFCGGPGVASPYLPILLLNLVVIGTIILCWLAVHYYVKTHR
ncbi:MAG: hypothetical protein HZB70_02445 [Candidatus Berkelbacteria bacterium]|nr:MAG: hypothetical protein HZB70_02445 [Candidatus Berkelbacteria bacterium]QQG51830.1 MAG: hypothetical protein HY845_00550 [Candidatus Berkelbacteria bacterium]